MEQNWNYKNDLNLLKQNLDNCTPFEKKKIQSMIMEILETTIPAMDSPKNSVSDVGNFSNVIAKTESVPETSEQRTTFEPSLIMELVRLMLQFKKDYMLELERYPNQSGRVKNSVVRKQFLNASWEQLEDVWSAFEDYFKNTLETSNLASASPFENDLVMEKILGYLPNHDLFNCRQLNSFWNDKVMSLAFPKLNFPFIDVSDNGKLVQFCNDANITSPFLFTRLQVDLKGIKVEECNSFFSKYGQYVKDLYIIDELDSSDLPLDSGADLDFRTKLRTIFQNITQTECIRIYTKRIFFPGTQDPFVFSSEELETFKLPKVQTLQIDWLNDSSAEFSVGLFKILPNVKVLHLTAPRRRILPPQIAEAIHKLTLLNSLTCKKELHANFWTGFESQKLKLLEMCPYIESYEDVVALEKFFQKQCSTLESLSFCSLFARPPWQFRLPCMKNLRTFTLLENCISFRPFIYIRPQQVPKLRTIVFPNLQELLQLFRYEEFRTVEDLRTLGFSKMETIPWSTIGDMFPNLKKLSVDVNLVNRGEYASSKLFKAFPNLEDLKLCLRRNETFGNINHFLSGFTNETEFILSQLIALKSAELMKIEPPEASLRDMKRLKKLELVLQPDYDHDDGDEPFFAITDIGVQLGLMRTQCLEQLSLRGLKGFLTICEGGAEMLQGYHKNFKIMSFDDDE